MTLNKKKPQNKGPRPWRFPISILSDPLEQQSIRDRLALFNEHNPIHLWELMKTDIQQFAREITAFSQKQRCVEISSLQRSLGCINKLIFQGERLEADRIIIENKIIQFCNHQSFEHEDDSLSWLQLEGSMSPIFLNLEDEKEDLFINELLVNDVPTQDINLILSEIHNFYQKLLSKEP